MTDHAPPTFAESSEHGASHFNSIRGGLLAAFARAEAAVTVTLGELAKRPGGAVKVGAPHLVGQRFETLAQLLGSDAVIAPLAKRALRAIERFREHDELRRFVCHGVAQVCSGTGGGVVAIEMSNVTSAGLKRQRWWMPMDEAEGLVRILARDAQSLDDRLRVLREKLAG